MALPAILKIPDADIPAILDRYRNGERIADIATEYACSYQALYSRLRLYCDSGRGDVTYHDLVTDMYVLRNLENELALDEAGNQLELTRGREKVKCSQWHLERRRSKLYGQKQEIEKHEHITIVLNPQCDVTPIIQLESGKEHSGNLQDGNSEEVKVLTDGSNRDI